MSQQTKTKPCPICQNPAEVGCLLGNPDYNSITNNGLVWFVGEPTLKKNWFPFFSGGEPIGEWKLFQGSSVKGLRCNSCNKIILDL